MNALLFIIRCVSPWGFLLLCVFSYFSGALFGMLYSKIKRTSWERSSAMTKVGYWVVRSFREYVAPGENLPDPRYDASAPSVTFAAFV